MINANKEKLQDFFQANLQFKIPFFQRAYVCSEDNWTVFWDHLIGEVEAYEKGLQNKHFIGTEQFFYLIQDIPFYLFF